METLPDGIALERHRDLGGRLRVPWLRRTLLCAIAVLPALALLGVFGQHPSTSSAGGPVAKLSVSAPSRLRGGLIFQVRVSVLAHRDIVQPQITFSRGWWESMSVNSIVPDPTAQSSHDGSVVLTYAKLVAGHSLVSWIYFQVNPTNVGKRTEDIALSDGSTPLLAVHRSLTISLTMDLVIRASVVFAFIFLVTRIVGRRELSDLEPFDLILLVVLGDLVQQSITQSDDSVTGSLIVISTIALLTVAVSWISFRSRAVRSVTEGEPVVLVQSGRLIERNMRRERITLADIQSEARQAQIMSVADLRWAILENDGRISCIAQSH